MSRTSSHHKGIVKEVSFDGQGKLTIKPNELNIVWGGDERYWKSPTEDGAELVQVCWLEVTKTIPTSSLFAKDKIYTLQLTFTLELKSDAFGWKDSPVRIAVKPGSKRLWKKIDLTSKAAHGTSQPAQSSQSENSKVQASIKFKFDGSYEQLEFGLYEIWRGRWKGGLIIRNVVIEKLKEENKP